LPNLRHVAFGLALLVPLPVSAGQDFPAWHHGPLSVRPSGFLDFIGLGRSASTGDSVSTRFGLIPLRATPSEATASFGHSRLNLKTEYDFLTEARISGYLEADFLSPPGTSLWHWRQYWGSVKVGSWEVLGGKGWSLLRPNREGIFTERGLMNTEVIDPAYHPGLAGARRRQARISRVFGKQTAAAAWHSNGDWEGKWALDAHAGHFEAAGLAGRAGRRALQVSAVAHVTSHLRIVTQQFWARRALNEALNLVAPGAGGYATLHGAEWEAGKRFEWYSYAGWVRSQRSAGNRMVRQFTTGWNWRSPAAGLRGVVTLGMQYSYLQRDHWDGREGDMHLVACRLRFAIP
jgi:hypothetical protein